MIRAVMTKDDGGKALILGVDDTNVERLTAGNPILIRGQQLGIGVDVIIMHGKTLSVVLDQLRAAGFNLPENPEAGTAYEHKGDGYQPIKTEDKDQ